MNMWVVALGGHKTLRRTSLKRSATNERHHPHRALSATSIRTTLSHLRSHSACSSCMDQDLRLILKSCSLSSAAAPSFSPGAGPYSLSHPHRLGGGLRRRGRSAARRLVTPQAAPPRPAPPSAPPCAASPCAAWRSARLPADRASRAGRVGRAAASARRRRSRRPFASRRSRRSCTAA